MIVVDSSVWINNIRRIDSPEVQLLRRIDQAAIIAGDIIVLEVLRGLRTEREATHQQINFERYGVTSMLGPDLAIVAASNYRNSAPSGSPSARPRT